MPDIKYFITTGDGQNHQVSEDNIKNYGIDSYANAYKDATIRMRNDKGEDYHVPLTNYNDAVEQGLHPFRFDAAPQKSQHTDNFGNPPGSGSVAREVVQEYEKSLHSNPQPSRQPAQQVKPSNVPGYLDRDRTESVVQDRSSWANNDFSKHGINKVHDINTNIQKQQIQDSKPVVNTGVPQENQYIIKTQGQQRQQAEESASNLNKKYISPYVDEALTEADKQARDVIDKSQHLFYGASTGLPQGDVYHAAGMQDPDRILKGLQDNIQNIYSDSSFIQNINSEANRIGISPQDYYSKYVQPQIQDQLENTFSQKEILKHMPRNKSEYLINGLTEGITGMVLSRLLPKKEVQYMNAAQQATEEGLNKDYTPGTGDKLEKFAVSFTSDAPFFGLTGKIASATVGAVVKNQIEKLTAKGLAEGTARSIIGTQLENSVGKRVATKIMQGSLSGSANLGAYNVMSEGARQFRDREFNPAQILERGASGVGTGAALGVTGGVVGGLSSKLSGAKKLLASAANYLTEAGTFTVTGEAEKYLKGEGKDIRWGQDFLQNIEQLGVMKATGGHFMERMKNLVRPETDGVHFTKDEIEHIRTSKSANSLFSALSGMQPIDSKFIKGEVSESVKDPNISEKRDNLSKAYTDFMQDPNNTFAEKQKVAIVLGGTVPEYKPLETGYRIDNTDKGSTVTTTDANGNAVNMINFNSEEEANNYVSKHQNNIMANGVSTMSENYPEESQRLFQDFIQEGHTEGQLINALAGYDHSEEGTQILNNFQQKLSSRINQANCFSKGLLTTDPKERHDVKLNLDAQTESITSLFKDNDPRLLGWLQSDPESTIQKMKEKGYDENTISIVSNYINAKATYDGMIQGVRDEIDEKVNQNNEKINSITNQNDGLLHPATTQDGGPIYIISGNVSMSDDGTIDHENSDKAIIIRDPETGEQKMISPMFLGSLGQAINSEDYAKQQEGEIRNYYSQKASDEIEGNGQITTENGNTNQVTVSQTEEQNVPQTDESNVLNQSHNNPDNGQDNGLKPFVSDDGRTIIPATLEDGTQVFLKDPSQNANNKFSNVDIMYKDEDGNPQTESIPASYIKEIGAPQMLEDYVKSKGIESDNKDKSTTGTSVPEQPQQEQTDNIVRDEKGSPVYEQTPVKDTIFDMTKQGADNNDILDYSNNMISELEKESKALEKKKPEFSKDFSTYRANKQALLDQREAVEKQKQYWKSVVDAITPKEQQPVEQKQKANKQISIVPRSQRNASYVKENKQMGDYLNLRDRVLRGIATGTKFLWNDSGNKKGLATELGFKGSEGERKKRIGILASAEKGGVSIDELAHNIWEEREGQPWQNEDVSDIKNEIIDVLSSHNGTRTMINEAMDMHEQPDNSDDSYEAQNYIAGFANSRHISPDEVYSFDSYNEDKVRNDDESISDDELSSIFADKYLKEDKNLQENGQENGKESKTGSIQGVRESVPTWEGSKGGSTGSNQVLQGEQPSSEGSPRQSSVGKPTEGGNVRPEELSNDNVPEQPISRDQYTPKSEVAKNRAKELDLEIESQRKIVSKAGKEIEKKRDEISSRNGLFGDTKPTELFNETSDLSSENLHKALDKYTKDYELEKNKLDNLLANRDKKLKDIDEAESKQGDMLTSETPEEANVKRMSDIQERLSDIDSQLMELQDEGITESPQVDYLNEEKGNLESEYKGLQEIKSATENNGNFSKDNNDIRFSIRNKENLDKRYFEAIKNGNMEEAQRIIENSASLNEYSNLKDYEYAHKAPNSGGINKKDFRNLEKLREVVDDGAEYPNLYAIGNGISPVPNDFFTPNGHRFYSEETPSDLESFRSIEEAIYNMNEQLSKYGEVKYIPKVRVYRAVPNSIKEGSVRNGGWVTPSKKYAEIHKERNLPGKGKIIEQDIPVDQLWWDGNSINEWGYDDGNNYTYKDTKNNKKLLDVITKDDEGNIIPPSKRFNIRNSDIRFNIKGKEDNQDTQLRDALIEKIRNSGIEVITDKEEMKNILQESDKGVKLLKTPNGEAYGFVKDGKIYIDTDIAGSDTPIHEYTHLWAEVIRKENPEEWKSIVSLMKDLPMWSDIQKLYTNLKDDDSLAEEVLATYSGQRGSEKLNEEKKKYIQDEHDIFSKAKIADLFNKVKNAIEKFWHRVSDFLSIHYTSAEDVADQALKDLLNEVNPKGDNNLRSTIKDENYQNNDLPEDNNFGDQYEDDGKMPLTNRNIGPILYNMAGEYTRRMNKDGVLGMVVHDNKTNVDQAKRDYENAKWLNMYKNELNGILPRCTETAKDRVLKLINEIDRTLDYYKRQAEGEEMWRTEEPPMFRNSEGKMVYHGTNKDFDRFDLSHVGEGQGDDMTGTGIYVSDLKGVASKIAKIKNDDKYIYKVDIPKDTGTNYIDWYKIYKGDELNDILKRINDASGEEGHDITKEEKLLVNALTNENKEGVSGRNLYRIAEAISTHPLSVLNKAGFMGVKYGVNKDYGYQNNTGNMLSSLGMKSYSIFNEKDLKIVSKIKNEPQIDTIKNTIDNVSEKLGGVPVKYVDENNIPDNVKGKIDPTTKGWYDPKDGSVTLYTPNITSEDDAIRTVFHEKLGHEGLKALFGSDEAVNKFGDFIFKSADKALRDEITKEAGRLGFPMKNPDGMSHAAQEVFSRIAEEGPKSMNEFSLWRKVKGYVIDLLNKLGLHIKGILSDNDLRYYIQKTGEALRSQRKTENGDSDPMFRKEGEPKKMKGETMRQFIDRIREWKKIEDAKMDKDDPMPEYKPADTGNFEKDAEEQERYYEELKLWKIRHNLYDIEQADDKFYNGDDDAIADPIKDKDIYEESMDNARLEADTKAINRYAKTDIIERRKLINGSAAEDSLFMKGISDRTDAIAKSLSPDNKITGKDIREALPFMIEGTYHGPIKVNEELETLMDDIKSWHDEMYNFLKEEGLYGEVGYLNNYISHIWDSEKSDAKAFENFVRTKNKYMQHRLVPTYQDGIDLGLVPKYKDVTEIMAEYGKTCAESVANNRLINAFKNYDIVDGDRRDPALSTISAPGYTRISVPGISDYPMADIWVHNSIKDRFNSVFGSKRTQGIPEWLTKTAHYLDLSASVMKKINLSVSGFHAVALSETLVGTEGPARALKDIAKYVIKESAFKGLPPAYAHPEDYKLAAKHLVRLGATDDYSIAEVQAITTRMRKIVEDFDKKHPKLADNPATFIAQTLDFMNKGFDTVLWKYIHDGFKLSGFKYYANSINQDFKDGKINGIERDKRLDEAGQMINDAFGGQFWDVINVSPALLKWMGRGLLSPDWTISTTRHGLSAMFGLGSLYSESGFQNYLFNNTKRMLGKDIPKNEYVDMRKKWGRQFYAIAFMAIGTMMNAINAYYRHKDEQDEKEKADEMRKSNPDYKSPYELAYPDGMKWYDYTMYGNSVGHQTHLFSGHYQDGTETYVRWGKQLREIPEMLYGRDGLSFPGPIIDRLSGKVNPIINLTSNLFSGASLNGFDNPYMKNKRGWAKEIGRLHVIASCFLPYSIPTDEEKEFKMTDLFMPSQKGMTKWSTINHFKTAILSGDLDYVGQTYKAAVLNGIDAESCLKAATTEVKAGQRQEMSDGIKSLQMAMDSFDNAKTLDEKKHLKSKIVKYLADSGYKSFSEQEAVGKVKDFLNGDDLKDNEVNSDKYIMAATADDIRGDYKISALNKKALEITNKVQEMYSKGESPETIQQYVSHYKKWFEIKGITSGYKSQTNSLKKLIGKEKNAMDMIRSCREETMKRIDSVN